MLKFDYLKWTNEKSFGEKYIFRVRYRIITGLPIPLVLESFLTSANEITSKEELMSNLKEEISRHVAKNQYPRYELGEHEVVAAYINE